MSKRWVVRDEEVYKLWLSPNALERVSVGQKMVKIRFVSSLMALLFFFVLPGGESRGEHPLPSQVHYHRYL